MGDTKTQTFDPHVMGSVLTERTIPATPIQALMEAGFGDEPEESMLEKQERLAPLKDAIETVLTERERWVIEAMFWRRMGLKLIARELNYSPPHIARIRDAALEKLRRHLEEKFDSLTSKAGTNDDHD